MLYVWIWSLKVNLILIWRLSKNILQTKPQKIRKLSGNSGKCRIIIGNLRLRLYRSFLIICLHSVSQQFVPLKLKRAEFQFSLVFWRELFWQVLSWNKIEIRKNNRPKWNRIDELDKFTKSTKLPNSECQNIFAV